MSCQEVEHVIPLSSNDGSSKLNMPTGSSKLNMPTPEKELHANIHLSEASMNKVTDYHPHVDQSGGEEIDPNQISWEPKQRPELME
jgi:hypothetical protein